MYGWRARIGVLVPSVNTCAEPQFRQLAPPGVEFFATRIPLKGGGLPGLRRMLDNLEDAVRLLNDLEPDFLLFHCTAGSMTGAPGDDQRIADRVEAASGRPATTTATAILAALRAFDARRLVLVTPYQTPTNEAERAFLEGNGYDVLNVRGLELESGDAYVQVTPEQWYRIVREAVRPGTDAVVVSCTNIRVVDVIAQLEADLGLPVVTSNQASVWHCLRRLGLPDRVPGYGRLLSDVTALPAPLATAAAR